MQPLLSVTGMVLKTEPSGEYDRRVEILTVSHGKISAFAKGARRQTNHLMAATDLFVFGDFRLYPGRSSYSMTDANVKNYFSELRSDYTAALYGMYFLEAASYNTRENNDEKDVLTLLYQALKALTHEAYDRELVKSIFEIKLVMLEGVFNRAAYGEGYDRAALYALDFLLATPPGKVFSFRLKEEAMLDLARIAKAEMKKQNGGHEFNSLALLAEM
ncbi:MAG: DNA repair protein RecO [Lachnospiraceae bacterium]|nr:DNA repair protein RecO [Lachnospiraceae bacterium]